MECLYEDFGESDRVITVPYYIMTIPYINHKLIEV